MIQVEKNAEGGTQINIAGMAYAYFMPGQKTDSEIADYVALVTAQERVRGTASAHVTRNGRALALKLVRAYEGCQPAPDLLATLCSLIARHAATHQRLAEEACNGPGDRTGPDWQERWSRGLSRRLEACERRLRDLVAQLPETSEGKIRPRLHGDPRGCTVKLAMPGELARLHDDIGREGVCVETGR